MRRIKDILKGVKCAPPLHAGAGEIRVKDVTDDSREVRKGSLFIACRGRDTDGHRFISEALSRGAAAVISDRDFDAPRGVIKILAEDARASLPAIAGNFYGWPSRRLKITAVTGTNGKTTVTYLLESILSAAGEKSGVIGTINYRIGNAVKEASNTTPGQLKLQSLFAAIVKARARHAIMEVSSHSLDQDRISGIIFDAALFTNLTREHLDYHGTMKRYFEAKAKLFSRLKKGGAAILNNDDAYSARLKKRIRNSVFTYGLKNPADITASGLNLSMDSTDFILNTPKGGAHIHSRLIGRHNVSNMLAAAAGAFALGIRADDIKEGLESFKAVPGRLQAVKAGQSFSVFVDYAHTADALYNVLSLLRRLAAVSHAKIITVFGCGGDRDRTKRPVMGNVACVLSDSVIITSDNPRSEDPMSIISEIKRGIGDRFSNYAVIPDRRRAIRTGLALARGNDIVLLAGKGHEKYQIIKGRSYAFDDSVVARSILRKMT
jgi:UDP-N-acetylmuramoyl-L-alanyl-D-glutamate--2,6-diaminopimelate ligase